jgi:hypothetical protein
LLSRNTVNTETVVEEANVAEAEYSTVMRVELPFAFTVPRTVAFSASIAVAESRVTVGVPTGAMIPGWRDASSFPFPFVPQFSPPQHQTLSSWSIAHVVPSAALSVLN